MQPSNNFNKLRVLHVVSVPGTGGVQVWVSQVAARQARQGYEVSIACAADEESLSFFRGCGEIIPTSVCYSKINPLRDLSYLLELIGLFRRKRFDIVHLSAAKAALYGRLAARISGVPVIIYNAQGFPFHDFSNPVARVVLSTSEKLLSRYFTDMVVCCGTAVQAYAIKHNLVPESRLATIVNGVEIPASLCPKEDARRALGLDQTASVVGMVGRLSRQKAPENFLHAAALVSRQVANTCFLVAGDGPEMASLKNLAGQLGIASKVKFLGNRDDIPTIMRALDVFALFSRWEGLPLAILEAMAAERPVVATAVDGNVEAVQHDRTGLLSPAEDVQQFADNLARLLLEPDLAKAMGLAGRKFLQNRFTLDRMAAELSDLYQRLYRQKSFSHTGALRHVY